MTFQNILKSTNFDRNLKVQFIKFYVSSVILYRVESWTLKINTVNKLEGLQICICSTVLKILWTERMVK